MEKELKTTYHFTQEMSIQMIMRGMSLGTSMYKVRSSDRWYRRKYKVDLQNMRLSYSPSTKHFWRSRLALTCRCTSAPRLASNVVDLFDLEEVRKGWSSDVFNKLDAKFRRKIQARLHPRLCSVLKEENCFSLVVWPGPVIIDLIAPNVDTRDAWVRGLRQLIAACTHLRQQHDEERWLKDHIRQADVNGNGSLTFEECLGLLNQLNISMRRKEARKLFDVANFKKVKIDGEEALEPDEFVQFYRSLIRRPELEEIMKRYSASKSLLWGAEELRNFLKNEQQMSASMEECENLIEHHEPTSNKIPGYLSLAGFQEMMLSPEHNIFNKSHRIIYQDMNQPLTNYYIASSHNTYLLSGQLIGESSIEGYIQALMRGCRCLELDTWDGPDGEPIIFHGYTLTSRILLRDVLEAIRKYAFRASQYPVILSLENHCSLPYQEKMALHFKTIIGDYLYTQPVNDDETTFPSPAALARKIFIKGKKPREEWDIMGAPVNLQDYQLEDEEEREAAYLEALAAAPPMPEGCEMPLAAASNAPAKGISPELSALVNYFAAHRFKSFEDCKECWQFSHMASFEETVALDLGAREGAYFVDHNRRHVSRIYPKGLRTDSSNYDPLPYWGLGCHMVALNYQTWDEAMFVNESKFAQNGSCGYILKPKYLNDDEAIYDPNESPDPNKQLHVTIKVISAQFLPKPNRASEGEVVDPYVSMKVHGHFLDRQKQKTKFISNNGFSPRWDETLIFTLHAPEEAIFHFKVKDANLTSNELIGQFALPQTSMMEGYRQMPLEDSRGEILEKATLFVKVDFCLHTQVQTSSSS